MIKIWSSLVKLGEDWKLKYRALILLYNVALSTSVSDNEYECGNANLMLKDTQIQTNALHHNIRFTAILFSHLWPIESTSKNIYRIKIYHQ